MTYFFCFPAVAPEERLSREKGQQDVSERQAGIPLCKKPVPLNPRPQVSAAGRFSIIKS